MRYVAVPVDTADNGVNLDGSRDFIAFVDASVFVDEGYVGLDMMGHGSTEEKAFADLLAKLGYKEALPLNKDYGDLQKVLHDTLREFFSLYEQAKANGEVEE